MTKSVPQHFLVPSKLSIPYLPENVIERERLRDEYIEACNSPLVVLCAPAGFGKTTAALHGFRAYQHMRPDARLCWFSLDPEDTDPQTFCAYFISAIAKQVPLTNQLCHAAVHDRQSQLRPLFGQLLYELDRVKHELMIVLDDYHNVESEEIHTNLAYLVKHLPPHVTLVMTTRSDPPASIMSLRLQGLVADLQNESLSFDLKEAKQFFQQYSDYQLNDEETRELLHQVEGWAVGLQLIVLGLKSKSSLEDVLARLEQKNLNVIDYFGSEVFDVLPEDVKQFMLNTSIVKRFNTEVADCLVDNINVHEVLEYLQRHHLFVVQFDEPQHWYRYHHLLREFLRHKLLTSHGGDIKPLHYKASQAFLKLGYIVGAVDHAIMSGDLEQITGILKDHGEDLIHKAHYDLVQRCLAELTLDQIVLDSQLVQVYCWVEAIFGDASKVDPCLDAALVLIESAPAANQDAMRGEFATLRSQAAFALNEFDEALTHARQALSLFPGQSSRRQSALLINANICYARGQLDEALAIYEESELLSRQESNHDAVLWSLNQQAQVWKEKGEFEKSVALSKEVILYAEQNNVNYGFNAVFSCLNQAEIAIEQYHLREARQLINQMGILCQNWDEFWSLHLFGWLLKIEVLKGKPSTARDLAHQHEKVLKQEYFAEMLMPHSQEVQMLWWWQQGEIKSIKTWLKAHPKPNRYLSARDFMIMRAELYCLAALEEYDQAIGMIESNWQALSRSDLRLERVRLGVLLATLYDLKGERPRALAKLKELLPEIKQSQMVASVLNLRQWLVPLLDEIVLDESVPAQIRRYVEQLIVLHKQRNTTSPQGGDEVPDALLALGVSKKEWRVLQHIIDGKSNDDIASTMFIAVSTVKTHINNLYKKLGVANRKEAIAKGQQLR